MMDPRPTVVDRRKLCFSGGYPFVEGPPGRRLRQWLAKPPGFGLQRPAFGHEGSSGPGVPESLWCPARLTPAREGDCRMSKCRYPRVDRRVPPGWYLWPRSKGVDRCVVRRENETT